MNYLLISRRYVDFGTDFNVLNSTKILLSSKFQMKDLVETDLGIKFVKLKKGLNHSTLL